MEGYIKIQLLAAVNVAREVLRVMDAHLRRRKLPEIFIFKLKIQ